MWFSMYAIVRLGTSFPSMMIGGRERGETSPYIGTNMVLLLNFKDFFFWGGVGVEKNWLANIHTVRLRVWS